MAVLHYPSLYWLFLKNRLKILMEYRMNFLIGATSTIMIDVYKRQSSICARSRIAPRLVSSAMSLIWAMSLILSLIHI